MAEESLFNRWFEKLKEVIKIDINFNNLISIQINNNNSTNKVDYNKDLEHLSLNYPIFLPDEKNKIEDFVRGAKNEGTAILFDETQKLIKDIRLKEAEPDAKALLSYYRYIIPHHDHIVLRSAIYIDKLAREGTGYKEIYRLKGEIGKRYGGRGIKICNLYASGYFETMIKPLYEEYNKDGFFDRKGFLYQYNIRVNEEAFAIFISDNSDINKVKTDIKTKIARNLKYGRRDVTIHSIGRTNIAKAREAISDIDEEGEYPGLMINIEEKGSILLAKLTF